MRNARSSNAGLEWEELGWIEVDTAGVAFCREGSRPNGTYRDVSFVENQYGFVYQATTVDCPLPCGGPS